MIEPPKFPLAGFSWDDAKCQANLAKHGLDFSAVEHFDFATALTVIDDRNDYGEIREIALGFIDTRLHVLTFTRRAAAVRVISLRKANERERNTYEAVKKA